MASWMLQGFKDVFMHARGFTRKTVNVMCMHI